MSSALDLCMQKISFTSCSSFPGVAAASAAVNATGSKSGQADCSQSLYQGIRAGFAAVVVLEPRETGHMLPSGSSVEF